MDDLNLRCCLCDEKYDDERSPKNLGCGHCLCTSCAEEIISRDKSCPECQTIISADCTSDLSVNYPLLRLIRTLASADVFVPATASKDGATNVCLEFSTQQPIDVKYCETHHAELSFRCMRCCVLICEECSSTSHPEPPQGPCRVVPLSKALEELKTSFIDKAGIKFKQAKQITLDLGKERSSLGTAIEQYKTTASSVSTSMEEVETNFRSFEGKLESQNQTATEKLSELQEAIDLMQQTKKSVEHAKTIHELLTAIEVANDVVETVEKCLVQEQHRPSPALPKLFSQEKYNIQGMLDAGKQVYATYEVGGKHRFAQVTGKDGLIHLHCLGEGAHAASDVCIPYKMVRRMVQSESPTVFLDVSIAGVFIGRVHVRMFGNTVRSRQTILLCSGELGHSYKYTFFFKSDRKGQPFEILSGGDYEHNNGTGGKGILPGITSGGEYRTEIVAGLWASWPADQVWRLGSFDIYLRQNPGVYDNSGHGIVTSGLDILRTVARHHPVKECMIHDCGLAIHL